MQGSTTTNYQASLEVEPSLIYTGQQFLNLQQPSTQVVPNELITELRPPTTSATAYEQASPPATSTQPTVATWTLAPQQARALHTAVAAQPVNAQQQVIATQPLVASQTDQQPKVSPQHVVVQQQTIASPPMLFIQYLNSIRS